MSKFRRALRYSLLCAVVSPAAIVACGSDQGSSFSEGNGNGDGGGPSEAGIFSPPGDFGTNDGGEQDSAPPNTDGFDVQPSTPQKITVTVGQPVPTVTFTATLNGQPQNVGWSVDRGNAGSIGAGPASSGVFSPSGATGGLVTITAGLNGKTIKRQVFVSIVATQNGAQPTNAAEAKQIAASAGDLGLGGGIGGVGGEGLGPAVADNKDTAALAAPTDDGSSQHLKFLYPYDKTVFPRGLLAPLLQWSSSLDGADAILIDLATTSGSYHWTGTFAKPAVLSSTGGKFIRHPIPQDVWANATDTAGGPTLDGKLDQLVVSLTVMKAGVAHGPIRETWTIAPGRLSGTVYYNSYGTGLVQNSVEASYNSGPQFGAAILGIREGQTGPNVVAGTKSALGNGSGCRVCHTVSPNGGTLIAQHGDNYARTSRYDLGSSNAETSLTSYDNLFGWAGISPDGTLALTNAADLAASAPATRLYTFPPTSTTPLTVTGIPANLQGGTPTFSPDGKHVAFDFLGGTIESTTGNGTQLVALDFDQGTLAFSKLRVLATMTGGKRAGFPSFFPTNDAVAFHYQIVNSNHRYNTWNQAKAQIWWSDLATGTAKSLNRLNGLEADGTTPYLPTGANNHGDDTVLNYEPTVNPVASGGFIWVIFTSRRLYGNVATNDPWLSDPRNYDMTDLSKVTTKKLWVAAIDLNAPAGSDPSHPAFYLPAQELVAGNARGFWVLDPCRSDGLDCTSGDQCCNGFCQPSANADAGALVCSNKPPNATCSMPQEKCTTAADCCDKTNTCVNGFCAVPSPHGVN
jgi:hypothetical protein